MVDIFFVRDGPERQVGSAVYVLPLDDCIKRIGLNERQWLAPLDGQIRFGDQTPSSINSLKDYRHVVAKVSDAEAATRKWRSGFYRIERSPRDLIEILGTPRGPFADC